MENSKIDLASILCYNITKKISYVIEGKMTINGTKLYFEYQNIAFTEDSGLTEMLDTIISFE